MFTAKHELTASSVSYDNSALLFPIGTDNVQEALDDLAAGGGGAVMSIRAGIDPTSSPGVIGGLLVTAAMTAGLNYYLPLTTTGALDIASPYELDPNGLVTIGADTITINQTAAYNIEFNLFCLSTTVITPIGCQVIRNGDLMFSSVPMVTSFCATMVDLTPLPISGIYQYSCVLCGAAQAQLTAGDVLSVAMYVGSGAVEIPLSAAISISIAQAAGPQGPPGVVSAMTPSVLGSTFGRQVISSAPNNSNCLGWQVDDSQGGCTVLYNDESGAAQSVYTKDSSISITNTCNPNPTSMLNGSIHVMNDVGFINPPTIAPGSVIVASNARYDTQVSSNDCIAIGTGGVGATIDLNASACAITNGLTAETLAAREFCASNFTSFRLRSLPAGTGNVVVYDPVTSLITDSGAPPGGAALALPTVAGTVYGDAAPTTKLQLGYNTSLTPTTGVNIYASSVSAAQGAYSDFDTPIYISSNSDATGQDVGYISIHNSTNLVHGLGFSISLLTATPGFTADNSGAVVISALASSLTDGGVSRANFIAISPGFGVGPVQVATNAIILTNGNAAHVCAADEFYVGNVNKWVVEGTIPTAPTAATNLFLRRDGTGEVTAGPLAPVLATVDTNDQILTRDSVSGLVSYNTAIKRTLSYSHNTDGSGQVTQNYSGLSLGGAPHATATVNNNSTTVAYTCNIIALNATDITIQVFSLTNPGPVLAAVGAGITVDIILSF